MTKFKVYFNVSFMVLMLISVIVFVGYEIHMRNLPGDVNEDRRVDFFDVMIIQCALEKDIFAYNFSRADINDDGMIDGTDIRLIENIINGV